MIKKAFLHFLWIFFVTVAPLQAAQENEPPKKEMTDDDYFDIAGSPVSYQGAFIKMILTLLGLIVLIVITVWVLKRISSGRIRQLNSGRSIKILERRPLSAKSALYIIEVEGKRILVSESQFDVRRLSSADSLSTDD